MTSGPATWRALLRDAVDRLTEAGVPSPLSDARRIVEEASGWEGADHPLHLDDPSTKLTAHAFHRLIDRRLAGEPLQYVLGRWGFRCLDLYVDRRVLIPRPETETVVGAALEEMDRMSAAHSGRPLVAVDLGTGSGAIALSLAVERAGVEVWATDRSEPALAVVHANLAGAGHSANRVRTVSGEWYSALPAELRGRIDIVVSNPPYVAAAEAADLPAEVADWEPRDALVPGPTGLEAIDAIVAESPEWLARPGALVVEHAPDQAADVLSRARAAGFSDVDTKRDLTGRPRMLVARLS